MGHSRRNTGGQRIELEWLTPLPWADPPSTVLHRICREARRSIPFTGGGIHGDPIIAMQPYLWKVYDEFHRRLRVLDIYVEGVDD